MTKEPKKRRQFDWTNVKTSQLLLKIAYVGTTYAGLAYQKATQVQLPRRCVEQQQILRNQRSAENIPSDATCGTEILDRNSIPEKSETTMTYGEQPRTIESDLFKALIKICLIKDMNCCKYSRCGRTDKGVCAAGNYVSACMRIIDGVNVETVYPFLINAVLPPEIRVVRCKRVHDDFDARFCCLYRVYHYYFPLADNLDIDKMQTAGDLLIGEHNFHHFCKASIEIQNYIRTIISLTIQELPANPKMGLAVVKGKAFLWHQVRCIMAILFMVGRGEKGVEVVREMLDVDTYQIKPSYRMAEPDGLVLYDCFFKGVNFDTTTDEATNDDELEQQMRQPFVEMSIETECRLEVLKCLAKNAKND